MSRVNLFFSAIAIILINGCSATKIPTTQGDLTNASSYGYHPLDPLPAVITQVKAICRVAPELWKDNDGVEFT